MIRQQADTSPLRQEAEMADSAESGEQLSVDGGVAAARPRQLLGEKGEGLTAATEQMLQEYTPYMQIGSICSQG